MPSACRLPVVEGRTRVRLITGQVGTVWHGYAKHPFILHRSIGVRGWTVTHRATGEALVQRLPSLTVANEVADQFLRLVSVARWEQMKWQYSFWAQFKANFNIRQQWAIAHYLLELKHRYRAL